MKIKTEECLGKRAKKKKTELLKKQRAGVVIEISALQSLLPLLRKQRKILDKQISELENNN